MLEIVNSGLYFVEDENNFINPLLQVESRSGSNEKVPDPNPHPCVILSTLSSSD